MRTKLIISIIFLSLLAINPVFAAGPFPAFPMSFYGQAALNYEALPSGTLIQAYNEDNEVVGEVVMPENGIFGYNNPAQVHLVVGEYNGNLTFKYQLPGSINPLISDKKRSYVGAFAEGSAVELYIHFIEDSIAPSVAINNPTEADQYIYVSEDPNLTVSGIATDNLGLGNFGYGICYFNPHCGGGGGGGGGGQGIGSQPPVPPITSKEFSQDFDLQPGNNYIYITVDDLVGNSASTSLTVLYSETDIFAPVRSGGLPTGTLPSGTSKTDIKLSTDEDAICHYSKIPDQSFASSASVFSTTGSTTHSTEITGLNDDTSYKYYIRCQDTAGNVNDDDFSISFSVDKPTPPTSSGGGGGGGGGSSRPPAIPEPEQSTSTESTATSTDEKEQVEVLGVSYEAHKNLTSLYGVAGDIVKIVSDTEAGMILNQSGPIDMDEANKKIYDRITKGADLTDAQRYAIAYFIQYGTPTTIRLGAGERAGALNSCVAAFGKFPTTLEEWMDVIKVANGRWPAMNSEAAEARAKSEFKKIYLRDPNMANPHDNAAVTIIAYGLRPANRNMDSEKAAIKTFRHIYNYDPNSAVDWDIVRAIAYSGAIR